MDYTVYPERPGLLSGIGIFFSRLFARLQAVPAEHNEQENSRQAAEQKAAHYLNDYGNQMLRLAYSYLHNYEDAEEMVSDAILKVLTANPSFEGPSHEKAYLLRVVANLSKNRIDYNKLRSTDELKEELVAEEREDLSELWEAVKQLPVKYREVIHLFYQEGYKTAEIAELLGHKEATVRSDLARGREKLKEILKEEYDFG